MLLLTAISAAAVLWCASQGYTLYYGDAEAHLNIARRMLDSRTPGPEQLGTVWLPLPHVLMLPFVARDAWWRSGIAGAIPSAVGFVIAGAFLFAAARRLYASARRWSGCGAAVRAESQHAVSASDAHERSASSRRRWRRCCGRRCVFRDSQSVWAVLAAAAASNAASLTRYEGWFLIPFVALYLLLTARRKSYAVLFAALAALGPLAWLAHNQYYYSNALEFYDGDFSAQAIYARQVAAGVARYPGDHNWSQAIHYYFTAVTLTQGWILVVLSALGAVAALAKKMWWPLLLLALPPAFYVWSMHSSGTPLYVPTLWPHSWYNTRYALAALPVAALAAAGVVAILPAKLHALGAAVLVLAVAASWALAGAPVCWKESAVNSQARRAWTGTSRGLPRRQLSAGRWHHLFLWRPHAAFCARPAFPCAKGCIKATARPGTPRCCAPTCFSTKNGRWPWPAIRWTKQSTPIGPALSIEEADYGGRSARRRDL